MLSGDKPIFQQLADHITTEILSGTYVEGEPIPSINEFAAYFGINPATANKGINLLVAQGVIFKKRGIGMFVAEGAHKILLNIGREEFFEQYVLPMVSEAKALGMTEDDVHAAVTRIFSSPKGR